MGFEQKGYQNLRPRDSGLWLPLVGIFDSLCPAWCAARKSRSSLTLQIITQRSTQSHGLQSKVNIEGLVHQKAPSKSTQHEGWRVRHHCQAQDMQATPAKNNQTWRSPRGCFWHRRTPVTWEVGKLFFPTSAHKTTVSGLQLNSQAGAFMFFRIYTVSTSDENWSVYFVSSGCATPPHQPREARRKRNWRKQSSSPEVPG